MFKLVYHLSLFFKRWPSVERSGPESFCYLSICESRLQVDANPPQCAIWTDSNGESIGFSEKIHNPQRVHPALQ